LEQKAPHAIAPAAQVPGAEQMNAGRANQNRLPGWFGVNPFDPGAVA